MKAIGEGAFEGCTGELIINCDIPDGNTSRLSQTQYPFLSGSRFTNVIIGNNVTSIGDYGFYDCGCLTSITIPDSVTRIGDRAFEYCSSLIDVVIPESVSLIGKYALYNCSRLTSVTCLATTPPVLCDSSLSSIVIIYVPQEALKAYKQDAKWQKYKKQIKPIK